MRERERERKRKRQRYSYRESERERKRASEREMKRGRASARVDRTKARRKIGGVGDLELKWASGTEAQSSEPCLRNGGTGIRVTR